MRGKLPLTLSKLTAACLELLKHPEVTLTFQHMTAQQGHCDWREMFPPTNIVIRVDANQQTGEVDHIGTVAHELIHVLTAPMTTGWLADDMEEITVLAYDAAVIAYIRKSPKRLAAWTETINAKLKESDEA